VLNNKNGHTLKLVVDTNKFKLEATNEASFFSSKMLLFVLGIIAFGFLSKLVISKKILK
jgi:hypothetical protein